MPGRAQLQAPGRGHVERGRIAVELDHHRADARGGDRLLGRDQHLDRPGEGEDEQPLGRDAVGGEARRMGRTGLAGRAPFETPDDAPGPRRGQRQREAGRGRAVDHPGTQDLVRAAGRPGPVREQGRERRPRRRTARGRAGRDAGQRPREAGGRRRAMTGGRLTHGKRIPSAPEGPDAVMDGCGRLCS